MQEVDSTEEYVEKEDFEEGKKDGWKAKFEAFLESKYFVAVALVLVAIIAFCVS
jgi:hypothetical protein